MPEERLWMDMQVQMDRQNKGRRRVRTGALEDSRLSWRRDLAQDLPFPVRLVFRARQLPTARSALTWPQTLAGWFLRQSPPRTFLRVLRRRTRCASCRHFPVATALTGSHDWCPADGTRGFRASQRYSSCPGFAAVEGERDHLEGVCRGG